jgi:hypothetical protein
VGSLFSVLTALGELRVFRVVTHLIRILPAVLVPLHELLRDEGTASLTETQTEDLHEAFRMGADLGPATGASTVVPTIPSFPNVADLLIPAAEERELRRALGETRRGLIQGVNDIEGATQQGLRGVSGALSAAAERELRLADSALAGNLARVREQSGAFAGAMREAQLAAAERPETGLEAIARAYEQWLTGDGLAQVLTNLTELFRQTPASDTGSLPGAVVGEALERPRASVEIDDVVIELSAAGELPEAPLSDEQAETLYEGLIDWLERRERRGGVAGAAHQVPSP